ncbi:hypothetical protein GCM10010924_29140 [Rhizobium wenxiniae]|nr:hypothetical protein GCM10010924_29140 [Rhizobium wenxiniae]
MPATPIRQTGTIRDSIFVLIVAFERKLIACTVRMDRVDAGRLGRSDRGGKARVEAIEAGEARAGLSCRPVMGLAARYGKVA